MSGPPISPELSAQMRKDWNGRAVEDANFYVAFGRRDQNTEEFFATAAELVKGIEWELKREPKGTNPRARRALEIGCGPGRLLKPLSRHFGEIHGVDVSDEMIERAKVNLKGIPHAHVHTTTGADLAPFADESFDLVYSFAVFQHIPSHDVVLQYLREAKRVLKPNGLCRVQLNGLPEAARQYDTWNGVRTPASEIKEFTRENNFQLLALEGVHTQYMWTTWRKRSPGWYEGHPGTETRIRRVTNSESSEPIATNRGRFASVSLWMEQLPPDCDLNHVEVTIGGREAFACYIGPPEMDGLQQLNVMVPPDGPTGYLPIELRWNGYALCQPSAIRIIPAGPRVPIVLSIADGINLLSGKKIVSGVFKLAIEEITRPETFRAWINGEPVEEIDHFCTDPLPPRFEINFRLPRKSRPGGAVLEMEIDGRKLAPIDIEIA